MSGGEEKRKHERVNVAFSLTVHEADRKVGTIEDISEGGMRVRLDGEIGHNEEVREWTGHRGTDNQEFVLSDMVGEEFTFTLIYMGLRMGVIKARLVRVIRSVKTVFFAMQFTEVDAALVAKVMGLVKKRK